MDDYDNPEVEAQWFAECRIGVAEYLQQEGIVHGKIAIEPAFYGAPYFSLWEVDSFEKPGTLGWWVIYGDLPTDYVAASKASSPREALRAIATLWSEAAQYMERGELHPTFVIGSGEQREELAELLAVRAGLLLDCVEDEEEWKSS